MNLCGRESLCDIRRDFCHHSVSERDFGRDAQRVCQADRSLMSPLGRDETNCVRLATNNVLSQVTVNFIEKCLGKESHRIALVHKHVLRFIVSEVQMPCSCSPKAKAIQSHVRKQNNCPSFDNKRTSSPIPTEQASFVSIYTVSIKHGLRTADCGLRTGYKART